MTKIKPVSVRPLFSMDDIKFCLIAMVAGFVLAMGVKLLEHRLMFERVLG